MLQMKSKAQVYRLHSNWFEHTALHVLCIVVPKLISQIQMCFWRAHINTKLNQPGIHSNDINALYSSNDKRISKHHISKMTNNTQIYKTKTECEIMKLFSFRTLSSVITWTQSISNERRKENQPRGMAKLHARSTEC